jgi:hypothetical protein
VLIILCLLVLGKLSTLLVVKLMQNTWVHCGKMHIFFLQFQQMEFKRLSWMVKYRTSIVQGGSDMTGTNCDLFTHSQSRSYLTHLVFLHRRWLR